MHYFVLIPEHESDTFRAGGLREMEKSDSLPGPGGLSPWQAGHRLSYEEQMKTVQATFESHTRNLAAGVAAVEARSAAVDSLVQAVWTEVQRGDSELSKGVSLVAIGGYGRQELFPYSDVDLMFLVDSRVPEASVKEPIRRLNQLLWDAGLRVSAMTRTLPECERFDAENVEFTLSLMDARAVAGDAALTAMLLDRTVPKVLTRDAKKISARLLEVARKRHARYGDTLFHLEPNIKECPGGLRDAHTCAWLARLGKARLGELQKEPEFREARDFLLLVRAFLHFRHQRDDNTLDWQAQDAAAAAALGAAKNTSRIDAAYWMRLYFRHARSVERCVAQYLDEAVAAKPGKSKMISLQQNATATRGDIASLGFEVRNNRIWFVEQARDPEHNPEVVLSAFAAMAGSGAALSTEAEQRIEQALTVRLSANLEDGPNLWRRLQAILTGAFAGQALRSMHALGILELVIPEFHGIDALVIRDAYHRYTVDEHTFVLIDTLHGLGTVAASAPSAPVPWASRFGHLFRDLPHPELLLLASLLHDTGKGHAAAGHAIESARMAANVLERLELDGYQSGLVLELIRNHLEMSAALRRDVFDQETIRSFAARVPNPESLRMLTVFTYADIAAVHPDALTPWKAENLWRLYNATAAYLDRNVDDERVAAEADSELSELLLRIHALLPEEKARVNLYLEGFPQRYLQTRMPKEVRTHIELAWKVAKEPGGMELDFRYAPGVSEVTLVTEDRPALFASMAGALAGWGMNILTADAFSNAHGVVVDTFRFTDTFRTLELNEPERERFVASLRGVMLGKTDVEALLASRKRGRRKAAKMRVEARVESNQTASSHSTLLQVVAQDTPGLLRALSLTIAEHGCNIEVALVDTEGETAIDVFYVTHAGNKLDAVQQADLHQGLLEAIEANAR